MSKSVAYILSLIAGILVLINGLVAIALPGTLSMIPELGAIFSTIITVIGVWGIICGIILIYGGYMINKGKKNGGIIVLIFSIIALFTASGFLIGAILGIIGGILGIKAK